MKIKITNKIITEKRRVGGRGFRLYLPKPREEKGLSHRKQKVALKQLKKGVDCKIGRPELSSRSVGSRRSVLL